MKKISFKDLLEYEKEYDLWQYTLFDYPLWIHCRESLLSSGMMVERKIKRPKIMSILKSFFQTTMFLFTQNKYDKVFFLMERAELLEIYKQEKTSRKLLFLNPEQERVYGKNDYISSDFFSLLRFISRKISFRIFRKLYLNIVNDLAQIGYERKINRYIQDAIGDAFFLRFLSLVLTKKNDKYYSGAVIPMGEKFLNSLNSYEVQHGVIHAEHPGYIFIPPVKNTLILYHKHYKTLLSEYGYSGNLCIKEYKKTFFEKATKRHFPIVLYTQPLLAMQEGIRKFVHWYQPKNFFIQKHPRDYFDYEIDDSYFVLATTPLEVDYPIMYTSSIVENYTLYNKNCYIYDIGPKTVDVEAFLKIYTSKSKSKIIIKHRLSDIYKILKIKVK